MAECYNTRPINGCFRPDDGSTSVPIVIHIIYDESEIAIGQVYTLPEDNEAPLDINTFLGGGTVSSGDCSSISKQHIDETFAVTASQLIGQGAYGYTAVLVLNTGINPSTINYTNDIGTINGVQVPIGYSMGVDGDDNGGILQNGVTLRAFGNAKWVVTTKY